VLDLLAGAVTLTPVARRIVIAVTARAAARVKVLASIGR
jgi:hypothetical protein